MCTKRNAPLHYCPSSVCLFVCLFVYLSFDRSYSPHCPPVYILRESTAVGSWVEHFTAVVLADWFVGQVVLSELCIALHEGERGEKRVLMIGVLGEKEADNVSKVVHGECESENVRVCIVCVDVFSVGEPHEMSLQLLSLGLVALPVLRLPQIPLLWVLVLHLTPHHCQ